jgi:hypothetical protein
MACIFTQYRSAVSFQVCFFVLASETAAHVVG